MFTKPDKSKPKTQIDSLVGLGTKIVGDVSFTGGLRVDGEVIGNVKLTSEESSTLVLSETGRIEGEVRVGHLVVNGTIIGPIFSTHSLELQSEARIKGDVEYKILEIHPGAVVEGRFLPQDTSVKLVELKLKTSAKPEQL